MKPLEVIRMNSLTAETAGRPEIVIGIIDGPVDISHPALKDARLRSISSLSKAGCRIGNSPACHHGTFVAGMLCAIRSSEFPGICPGCSVIFRPILYDKRANQGNYLIVTPSELAAAIVEIIEAGARIINLSVGLSTTPIQEYSKLHESFQYAFKRGVLVVAAAGNHGRIGYIPLFHHPWIIPVAACDLQGKWIRSSNIGPSVGKWGLMAPGLGITSLSPGGGHTRMTGTSAAAPLVTGAIALLWSLFPGAGVTEVKRAILLADAPRTCIIPPLLNGEVSWRTLEKLYTYKLSKF